MTVLQVALTAVFLQRSEHNIPVVGFQRGQQRGVPAKALARSDQARLEPEIDRHRPLEFEQDRFDREGQRDPIPSSAPPRWRGASSLRQSLQSFVIR